MQQISLIIGLGNPGNQYAATRHNVGYRVVDELAGLAEVEGWRQAGHSLLCRLPGEPSRWLAKPLTYMNRSGLAVVELTAALELALDQVLVVVDDIDLPLGRLRLRSRGGPGSHNGLRDIVDNIGSSFARLRVGARGEAPWQDLAEYVLSPFTEEEQTAVEQTVSRATSAVRAVIDEGMKVAMDRFNRAEAAAKPKDPTERDSLTSQESTMVKAIQIHQLGGPEALQLRQVEVGQPAPGEALIRHTAIGLNFIDTYHRTGLYQVPLPAIPGMEAAGVVEAIGDRVTEVAVGDRVAYASPPVGAYAEARLMAADRLVLVPDDISDQLAAAALLKGMTVQYLLRRTYRVKPGETILLHAAAGGVGLIASQWAAALGATVIGTVGSEAKAELARAHGCHHPIFYRDQDWVAQVKEITKGAGVPVVYDSVGQATWQGSLDCLQPLGLMVSFGNASGAVPPFQPVELAAKGSLFLTRPTLMTYNAERADLLASAAELFEMLRSGAVKVEIRRTYPLAEAAQAHRDLESRQTSGSSILLP